MSEKQQQQPTGAAAPPPPAPPKSKKLQVIEQVKAQLFSSQFQQRFLEILNDEAEMKKELAFAVMLMQSSDKLFECDQASIIQSVFHVATTGLSLNPVLKYAALVPRWTPGGFVCSLMPMYQGLVKLVTDTGSATSIRTHLVHEGDVFKVELGDEYKIVHSPDLRRAKDAKTLFAYSIALLHDGSKIFEVMTAEEIEKIRDHSDSWKAYKAGKIKAEHTIWVMHEGEMFRKTVLRRLIKYLPKTDRFKKLSEVLTHDEDEYLADTSKIMYLETLIDNSTFDVDKREDLKMQITMTDISNAYANQLIDLLKMNQIASDKDVLKRISKSIPK